MPIYSPAPAAKQEHILKWLGSSQYGELQKMIDILIDEQFSLAKDSELKAPMDFLKRNAITHASSAHLTHAMRLRICSEVLEEILSKTIILKTNSYGQTVKEDRSDPS